MECAADESINEISVMCSAQSGKTLTMLALLLWIISEEPGPILWVTSNLVEAKKFARTRLIPMMEKCLPLAGKLPTGRGQRNTLEIYFPGAPLIIVSGKNPAALQGTPFRYLFLDELRSYKKGALEMVENRTTSFPNYKKFVISTPDMEGDAVDRSFKKGTQEEFECRCMNPECDHYQPVFFGDKDEPGGIRWDTNDQTCPGGEYDFDRLIPTIRYECGKCKHSFPAVIESKDEEGRTILIENITDRKAMQTADRVRWVRHNDKAAANCVSFHWEQFLPWWTSWPKLVRKFIEAKYALKSFGDHEPMKSFWNETRGRPWSNRLRFSRDELYVKERFEDYDPLAPWPLEVRRIMAIDVQGKGGRHYYWGIRAFAQGGASRLIAYGKAWSIDQIKSIIKLHGVDDRNVCIDTGHFTSEVYKNITESPVLSDGNYSWKGMKGDKGAGYVADGVRYLHSITMADPAIGTNMAGRVQPIINVIFSKSGVLDRMELLMRGQGQPWSIAKFDGTGVDLEGKDGYLQQITAYDRRSRRSKDGMEVVEFHQKRDDDHLGSVERMIYVAATASGVMSVPPLPLALPSPPAEVEIPEEEAA